MGTRNGIALVALILAVGACRQAEAPRPRTDDRTWDADVIRSWNAVILEVAEAEDGFLTLKGVRAAAMMHLAMHDVLNVVAPRFETFGEAAAGGVADIDSVNPVNVVNEAAFAVAVGQYPDRRDTLEAERRRWQVEDASSREGVEAARALARRTADRILEARADDGWDEDPGYSWHPMGPGVYAEFNEHSGTPEGFVFGAGWAEARPFALERPNQFRSGPPPEISSEAYVRAYEEVKEVGGRVSSKRTADQAHLAMWWKQFVEKSHNRLARELTAERGLGLWETARFFALLNVSIFDGYVASFDSKFHYNHWRPYTAIRWAANDGNPATRPDTAWTNLHDHTYAFPSYPSAHGTVCAAAMTVFEDALGEGVAFDMTIREVDAAGPMSPQTTMDPATRSFESFDEAAVECSLSRVYLGIHFRYDSEAGTELGRHVGEVAVGLLGGRTSR